MTKPGSGSHVSNAGIRPFFLLLAVLAAACALLHPSFAQAQPTYTYGAFYTDFTINADGSLLVRNEVTYEFQDGAGWVGLFLPSSYGTVVEGRVLDGDGTPLPDGTWEYEQGEAGYTLWCYAGDAANSATYIYEYLVYGSLTQEGDRVEMEWNAVPEGRNSPIEESSVTLRFPQEVDPNQVELDVYPVNYSGQISDRIIGGTTAVIEANWLENDSSYSFRCSWPSSIMDLQGAGFTTGRDETTKSWDFERFDVDIQVNEDSSYTVRETQVVNFRGGFHYLNRQLSTETAYAFDGRTYGRVRIHDIAVYDLDGRPYGEGLWEVGAGEGGKTVKIEFQAQDEQRGWIIEYRMTGATIFAADYDRLYWNAVSIDRDVPIRASEVRVRLPAGTAMEEVRSDLYVDSYQPPGKHDHGRDGDVLWWRVEDIPAHTTYTIDVVFPKGVVRKPWQYDAACGTAVIASSSFLLLATVVLMLALWWRRGRDIGRSGTAMVRYDPPQGLAPAMVGMLVNERPRVEDISATIVDLARRGYLTIFEEEKRSLIRMRRYGFQRRTDDLSALLPYEREIMEGLFAAGERVSEDDLANKFYTRIDSILNRGVRKEVMEKGLFVKDPRSLRCGYILKGTALGALPLAAFFFLPAWLDLGWVSVLFLAFVPIGTVVATVGWAMPRRSREGSRAYEAVLGFREYLETAEKPELEYMTPENFQANLPYAMVLGVSDAWARKFRDIYTTPPQWFVGTGTAFSTVHLASSLDDMTGSLSRTLTSSPRSSSGSGGGGFGGGFSGGGFGGGGSSAG